MEWLHVGYVGETEPRLITPDPADVRVWCERADLTRGVWIGPAPAWATVRAAAHDLERADGTTPGGLAVLSAIKQAMLLPTEAQLARYGMAA